MGGRVENSGYRGNPPVHGIVDVAMTLTISREQSARLIALAASSPRNEVCGLLLGQLGRVEQVRQARNVAPEPDRIFEIDPGALFKAIREERAGGMKLIGCFHSHPAGDARPSQTDFDQAAIDGRVWVIIAGGELAAWRRTADAFVEVEIEID